MRGGTRPGAGRKPGVPNKRTAEQAAAVVASGMSPLDYLLSVYRDEGTEASMRLEAAKAAAPYVHARLASIQVGGDPEEPIKGEVRVVLTFD